MKNINLIVPANSIVLSEEQLKKNNIYFLAGPILGGGNWQKDAIKMLEQKDPGCYVVCPWDWYQPHELYASSIPQDKLLALKHKEWTTYYMELSAKYGSLIFWLPCEKQHTDNYIRDTYYQLKLWGNSYSKNWAIYNITIGAEGKFPSLSIIKKNWLEDSKIQPSYPTNIPETLFYTTIEDTIIGAINNINQELNKKLRAFAREHSLQ